MSVAAIFYHDAEPFEQIHNMPSTEDQVWNQVKIGQAVSEKKTFKDYDILYMYIAKGYGKIILVDKILIVT